MVIHHGNHVVNLQGESLIVVGSSSATIRGRGRVLVCTTGTVDIEGDFVVTVLKGSGTLRGCSAYLYGNLPVSGDANIHVLERGRKNRASGT